MSVSRRQFVTLGAAAGLALADNVATSASPAAAGENRLGGVHIYCLLKGVSPAPFNGFPFSVMFSVWGADAALNGMGWGATVEGGDPVQSYGGASLFSRIFSAHGSVESDLVKLKAIQIFSADRIGQGFPWLIEANLATGAVRGVEVNAEMGTEIVLEGKGVVARI